MNLMISLGDLIAVVLFILGSTLLIYLILAISRLFKVLGHVNEVLESSKEDIQKTVKKLPEITDNAASITGTLKDNLDSIQHIFSDVGKISNTVKEGVETIQKDIILKAKSILDIIDAIKRLIEKRRENSKNKNKKKSTVYKYTYKPGQTMPDEVEIMPGANSPEESDKPHEGYVKVAPENKQKADDISDYTTSE